ncbi:MAG: alpha/beta fold hydrolase [Ilumatobacter sp.]|nr:alpha/beta fold hydrolase [Ilumatobacter sp.]
MPGAEPTSHVGARHAGVLMLHGFTGNPSSVRNQAQACVDAGFHVESPRLPGHGTAIEEMLDTGWADWSGEVEAAYARLAARVDQIVVMGLSMGGSLTLWTGLEHPDVRGLVCVNPATQTQPSEVLDMIAEMLADGVDVMPGIGSDIADPSAVEIAYPGTPLRPLLSFLNDGLAPITDRFGELAMPILLYTSRQDHVVDPASSEHLAATAGGAVEHVWLDRSYHVATQDYDRDTISAGAIAFVERVTGA